MELHLYNNNFTQFQGIRRFHPTRVNEKLLRGASVTSPFKLKKMKNAGITQIIDLRNSSRIERPIEKLFCKLFGIKYVNKNFPHRQTILPDEEFFDNINKSILKNKGQTYLHCEFGKHRTGLVAAIFEKEHTNNSEKDILNNMVENGYVEINSSGKTKKEQKYISLYKQMIDRYFT